MAASDALRTGLSRSDFKRPPMGTERNAEHAWFADQYLSSWQANFPEDAVTLLDPGHLEYDASNTFGTIVRVGPFDLIHSLRPLGLSSGVEESGELRSGDPLLALDYCIAQAGGGNMMMTKIQYESQRQPEPAPGSVDYEKVMAHNAKINEATAQFDAWQLMYTKADGTIGFQAVLPPDPSAPRPKDGIQVPTEADIQAAVENCGAANPALTGANFQQPFETLRAPL